MYDELELFFGDAMDVHSPVSKVRNTSLRIITSRVSCNSRFTSRNNFPIIGTTRSFIIELKLFGPQCDVDTNV